MEDQLRYWKSMNPTAVHTGKLIEVPASYTVPRVAALLGLAGLLWWGNQQIFWTSKPNSLTPEYLEEVNRIGNVAQRMNAPPVFLNPFRNRIPGSVSGPEDVKKALE